MDKKILVVDDDPGVCNSLALLLSSEGYSVDKTTDSREAITLIRGNRYDACLFDYKMEGVNGAQLVKVAKDVNPRCPVFIVSGMLDIERLCAKEIEAGLVTAIIRKPFHIETLLDRIKAAV